MKRLALTTSLGLAVVGCAHSAPTAPRVVDEGARCTLIQTLMTEPVPSQHLEALVAEGKKMPVQVAVFVRRPEEGQLERFFEGEESTCGDPRFRIVSRLASQGLVLYLQETPDGYSYDARRAGPDELSMGGEPQGVVRRDAQGGWATATD